MHYKDWAMGLLLASAGAAQGAPSPATCAQDLTAIAGTVTDSAVEAMLETSVEERINELGGIEAGLSTVEAHREALAQLLAAGWLDQLLAGRPDAAAIRQGAEDGLKMDQALLEAMQCEQSALAAEEAAAASEAADEASAEDSIDNEQP